jgi:hypothetical protein
MYFFVVHMSCGRIWLSMLAFCLGASVAPRASANPVLDWNGLMLEAVRAENTSPTLCTRNLAIMNTALYDAVNSITRTHQPYRTEWDVQPGSSAEAAVIAAGRETMLALYPGFRARTENLYELQLAKLPQDPQTAAGLQLGRDMAMHAIHLRGSDGATTEIPYIPSAEPGQWRRTPPFFRPPLTPHWGGVRTFCIPEIEPFLPNPPPALNSEEYARDFNEVKLIGEMHSSLRTAEQSLAALFWSDFSYTAMPPGHWQAIAATICRSLSSSLPETARLFALLSLAQADAGIVCWAAKYKWNLWRPVTAIHRAGEDGNPLTAADLTWDHYLTAPPFPAYPSGHSTFSEASARVIADFYGTDSITFSVESDSMPGAIRTFRSLKACADEVGRSRIYGGIHFQFDNTEGKRVGGLVGDYVAANFLLPNDALPQVRLEGFRAGAPLLRIHGRIGGHFVLEWSSDLSSWHGLSTNLAAAGGLLFSDDAARNLPVRFYRVRQ